MMTNGQGIRGLRRDISTFLLKRPAVPTLITFNSQVEHDAYSYRIQQRLQIDVSKFKVLNVHQIGIDAPGRHVFEEIERWGGDSTYWPNHIAEVERHREQAGRFDVFLLGQRNYPFGFRKNFIGLKYIPLFRLSVMDIQQQSDTTEIDNARYILFKCSGGYPIGYFCMFTRAPIAALGERGMTQAFMMVGFDFYGKNTSLRGKLFNPLWEALHNRTTSNILNQFKQLCEHQFHQLEDGIS